MQTLYDPSEADIDAAAYLMWSRNRFDFRHWRDATNDLEDVAFEARYPRHRRVRRPHSCAPRRTHASVVAVAGESATHASRDAQGHQLEGSSRAATRRRRCCGR